MADKETPAVKMPDPVEFSQTMEKIAEQSQAVVSEFLARQTEEATSSALEKPQFDPLNIGAAFLEMTTRLMSDPMRVAQAQMDLWSSYMQLWQATTARFLGAEEAEPFVKPEKGDRRFKDAAWQENAVFDYIKQSYLLTARWMHATATSVEGLDDKSKQKIDFYTRQFIDAMAPSNFVLTNPEVLRTTLESGGENLLKGLQNLLHDLEQGKGQLKIRMTDKDAFTVGGNIATTEGKVVFRNDLIELIQYTPKTEEVARRPLLIVPPWINKYYILDLRPENSFIKWAVEQGQTVFVISWVNPDEKLAGKSFEDYMFEGPLAAMEAMEKATGEKELNMIGYCLGGTLTASTLAYMAAKGDDRVKSCTFFTTLVDFDQAGELSVFIDEEQLAALEAKMNKEGYLDGSAMATTFNMLRANDLIWSFVVNNYLLGKDPFPFDLLYWNGDSTRMPAAMHSFYLRKCYQENKLKDPGGIQLGGVDIDLAQIKTPVFILSTKEDHIAPWKATYAGTQLYSGPIKFVLSGSGHIAGVVNPPTKPKYGFWTYSRKVKDPDQWLAKATHNEGSWWPEWDKWVGKYAGGKVPARVPGDRELEPLADAPGTYVTVQTQA
ncbi:MAG: class I poly(R)-hydroxyalkanoic acid synthase [Alphaproteobacteria bacterium]|nr:class I poly(R)-hydroxyalkanoic acid synthase [Alphaproteobacteria bacterium]